MANPITTLFNHFSKRSREGKNRIFSEYFPLTGRETILDLGGELGEQVQMLIDTHPDKRNITVVNIDQQHLERIKARYPEINVALADACELPYADNQFDIVYSNAVIEHVGVLEDQERMAREVMRVGKGWFVTTPNRWYPFEFHLRMPLIHWLPRSLTARAARLWSFNHVARHYQSGLTPDFRLLSVRQMRQLFPGSKIIAQRITFWPETIVVVGKEGRRADATNTPESNW